MEITGPHRQFLGWYHLAVVGAAEVLQALGIPALMAVPVVEAQAIMRARLEALETLQQRHQCRVPMVAQVELMQTTDQAAAAAERCKLVLRDSIKATAVTVAQGVQIPSAASRLSMQVAAAAAHTAVPRA